MQRRRFAEDFANYLDQEMGPDDMSDTSEAYFCITERCTHTRSDDSLHENQSQLFRDWFVNEWLGERYYRENRFYSSTHSACRQDIPGQVHTTQDIGANRDEVFRSCKMDLKFLDDERVQREDGKMGRFDLFKLNFSCIYLCPHFSIHCIYCFRLKHS